MDEPELLGKSEAIAHVRQQIARVARTPLPILINGETGCGKEVAARMVHARSERRGPFVPVDCAALSPSLIESELFGHERGAFTGANQRREGLVHAARGGTFFLDEIGELSPALQTRLLRLLEDGTYRPVGSERSIKADIRVVAATWRNLKEQVRDGTFRRDLYHRLSVVELTLPPLRAREDDASVLLDHFMTTIADRMGRVPPVLDRQVKHHLASWPWPGNVRELKNVASYLVAMTQGPRVRMADLPRQVLRTPRTTPHWASTGQEPDLHLNLSYMDARRRWLDDFQIRYVEAQIAAHDGNISAAARAAGMDRRSIQRILKRAREGEEHER